MGKKLSASFRDPSGVVYTQNGKILRQINEKYKGDYDYLLSSNLYENLTAKQMLVSHIEVEEKPIIPEITYKVIQPERINFISYPYEWSFSQLKDAALLTLAIQREALNVGMVLKDASAYNIQFHNGKPILIDTLSFTRYIEGEPWVAYRQFCQHFLAPLALMSKTDIRLNKLLIDYIDGIPLDLCSKLLPKSSKFNLGLATHIHLHSRAQSHFSFTDEINNIEKSNKKPRITKLGLLGLIDSLENTVKNLSIKTFGKDWLNYYTDTNYSDEAFSRKKEIIRDWIIYLHPQKVLDLGANTGVFSREAANAVDCFVLSTDIDPEAIEFNYCQLTTNGEKNILPLVIDLTNPPPSIGWDNLERDSFYSRGQSDVVLSLALIHHLAIANNVPLCDIALTMANLGKFLILEFIPKEDSQVQRLLRSRDDIFEQYSLNGLLDAFSTYFDVEKQENIPGSARIMLLFKRK